MNDYEDINDEEFMEVIKEKAKDNIEDNISEKDKIIFKITDTKINIQVKYQKDCQKLRTEYGMEVVKQYIFNNLDNTHDYVVKMESLEKKYINKILQLDKHILLQSRL